MGTLAARAAESPGSPRNFFFLGCGHPGSADVYGLAEHLFSFDARALVV